MSTWLRSLYFVLALMAIQAFVQNTDVYANPTSVTTCTENALGDQTCTTVTTTTTTTNTPGTTTGNVLTNSTFGTFKRAIESVHPIPFTPIVPNFIFSFEPIILDGLPNAMGECVKSPALVIRAVFFMKFIRFIQNKYTNILIQSLISRF